MPEFAQAYNASYNAPYNAIPQMISPSHTLDFARWRDDIGDIATRCADLSQRLLALGNELFGAEPEPVSTMKGDAEPHCQVAALENQIVRLRTSFLELESRAARFNRLA